MKNANIIFTSPRVAELVDKDMPEIKSDYDVLIKTAVTTVSAGTERANLIGDPNTKVNKGPSVSFPRRCGYSSS